MSERQGNDRFIVKLKFQEELRRISTLPRNGPFTAFTSHIAGVFAIEEPLMIKYQDGEGDLVTVGSMEELELAFTEARNAKRIPKLMIDCLQVPLASNPCALNEVSKQENDVKALEISQVIRDLIVQYQNSKPGGGKWRPNGPRGCRGSGKSKHQNN